MKSKLSYLIKYNLKRKFKSKMFIIINIALLILLPVICNIDTIIKYFGGNFDEPTYVYITNNEYYSAFESLSNNSSSYMLSSSNIEFKRVDKDLNTLKKEIKDNEKKHIIFDIKEAGNEVNANVISYEYVDTTTYQSLVSMLNTIKQNRFLLKSNIDKSELANIYKEVTITREYLTENLDENNEFMTFLGSLLIPVFILPLFFLIIMVVNSIGAEINEEKTSRSMEIIISSVSPKIHFFAKILSTNIFVLVQSLLLLFCGVVGIVSRGIVSKGNILSGLGIEKGQIVSALVDSGILENIIKAIPAIIIMFLLTFLAYSLLAGILASMTTSMEDYQQLQTPLMLILMFAYYIAIISSVYDQSVFIKIVSYIPFVSGLLSPILLMLGQITAVDTVIAAIILVITNYILIKYGLKIYKVGILNYSSSKLWKKMADAVKAK